MAQEERFGLPGALGFSSYYLGGQRTSGIVGRGSGQKISLVAAVSLTQDAHPLRVKLFLVPGLNFD